MQWMICQLQKVYLIAMTVLINCVLNVEQCQSPFRKAFETNCMFRRNFRYAWTFIVKTWGLVNCKAVGRKEGLPRVQN